MRYLLDTHTFLWDINDSPRLSRHAHSIIESNRNELFLSVASLWEIAIKLNTGKLRSERPFLDLAVRLPAMHDIEILQITPEHLDIVSRLPLHHRDPFDRLLVAQCLTEELTLVSNDATLGSYGVERLW